MFSVFDLYVGCVTKVSIEFEVFGLSFVFAMFHVLCIFLARNKLLLLLAIRL